MLFLTNIQRLLPAWLPSLQICQANGRTNLCQQQLLLDDRGITSSARRKEKCCSSVAMVAARLTLARDWPTQLRGPSAKGK